MSAGAAVRQASAADAGALADLRWAWRAVERGEAGMPREEFSAAFADWASEHAASHLAFLAEVGPSAVGMAWLAVIERVPGPQVWSRRAGHLQSVYVLPEHRNGGVGSVLVEAALDAARDRRLDYVIVHPSERSFPFYRRLGFRDAGGALEVDLRAVPAPYRSQQARSPTPMPIR